MRLIVFLWCVCLSSFSFAEEICESTSIGFGGWSHHQGLSEDTYDYNESHDIFGISCDNFSVMSFKNSYYEDSFGVGYETPRFWQGRWGHLRADVNAYVAVWTDYYDDGFTDEGLLPVGGLRASAYIDRFRVAITSAYYVTTLHFELRLN